ncbi:hypothetical protein [Lactobacillus kitasatonis]|uniref:hypothetical protein n=1 Tax=Lactobacillus kitasatonis TaxID=237446 RepID=UPI0026F054DD|nr:hypothetical protein [Lactobacillus kitasatonis]
MDVDELDNFEEVRNNLQMIEEMLSNVTPDMSGKDVIAKAKPILHTCHKVLQLRKKENRLTPEKRACLKTSKSLTKSLIGNRL